MMQKKSIYDVEQKRKIQKKLRFTNPLSRKVDYGKKILEITIVDWSRFILLVSNNLCGQPTPSRRRVAFAIVVSKLEVQVFVV